MLKRCRRGLSQVPSPSLLLRSPQRDELDLLAPELDLKLIAGLEAQLGGVGTAHHEVAVELHLGGIAQAAARTALDAAAAGTEAHALGFQQRFVEGGEVQALCTGLRAADIAAAAHQIGLGGIAQFLDLGEQFTAGEHDLIVGFLLIEANAALV